MCVHKCWLLKEDSGTESEGGDDNESQATRSNQSWRARKIQEEEEAARAIQQKYNLSSSFRPVVKRRNKKFSELTKDAQYYVKQRKHYKSAQKYWIKVLCEKQARQEAGVPHPDDHLLPLDVPIAPCGERFLHDDWYADTIQVALDLAFGEAVRYCAEVDRIGPQKGVPHPKAAPQNAPGTGKRALSNAAMRHPPAGDRGRASQWNPRSSSASSSTRTVGTVVAAMLVRRSDAQIV